jgi:hypothetical protein
VRTDCSAAGLDFGRVGSRQVIADFGGGRLSSDGGGLLLRLAEERTGIIRRFVERCMADHRDPGRVEHSLVDMVKQRVFGLCLGYEDLNDHTALMSDPLLAAAVGKADPTGADRRRAADRGKPLASSATLNRLELTPESPTTERYKRIDIDPEAADDFFIDYFIACLRQRGEPPTELVLDLDPSDVQLHGQQEGRFFHGYYGGYCYMPLYAFCGDHHLAVRLQTADGDPARSTVEVLERIVCKLRAAFPGTRLILRGDSGFSREHVYAWCEANKVDYVIGMARNDRLVALIEVELAQAKALHEKSGQPERVFSEFQYTTLDSWTRERRVVAKAEHIEGKTNPRFVVTSMSDPPQELYEVRYCARGEAENRIKEEQLYLFGTRASAGEMRANQNRFYFSALAYMLMLAIRELGLAGTDHAAARTDTIRLKLFKIAAVVRVSFRKIWVQLSSHAPLAATYRSVHANLVAAPTLLM